MKGERERSIFETVASLGGMKVRVTVNENLLAEGEECFVSPHDHLSYEMRYFAAGTAELVIDKRSYRAAEGELFLLHPGEYHYQPMESLRGSPRQYSLRFMPIAPSERAPKAHRQAYEETLERLSVITRLEGAGERLRPLLESLDGELKFRRFARGECIEALLCLIMAELLRAVREKDSRVSEGEYSQSSDDLAVKMEAFFSRFYNQRVLLRDFAEFISVSPRHASRLIRKRYGKSFVEKLTDTRIEQAKFLLTHTSSPLHSVASDSGFQNYCYFTACFQKHLGMTPSEYRSGIRSL